MNNVISTRVSVFRNVKDYKFENKLIPEQKEEITKIIESNVKNTMYLLNVSNADEKVLKHLKDNAIIMPNTQNLFVDKKEDLAINMFSGEHLTIVSTCESFNKSAIDKVLNLAHNLANKISFSFNDEYGFLMSDISKVGAGLKIETNIMLSAIKSINKIDQVRDNVSKLGYSLNETKFPAVYTLSTTCNLGISEKQVCSDFESTLLKLQDLETESAKMLDVSKHDEIIDKAQRSLAILNSAYMLNYDELYNMIVNLRLAINLSIVDVNINKINKLQKLVIGKKNDFVSPEDMKELAKVVKVILKGEENV